jgi:tyrosine-specific transport protein
MNSERKQTWLAAISLVGAIVGVGVFGVPYVISQVGAVPALVYFLALGTIQILQNLFFAEAAIASAEDHGLPGLARLYLGRPAGQIGGMAVVFGYWASLTAYVAVGGTFLAVILQPWLGGSAVLYSLAWGIMGALAIKYGLKTIARLEFIGTVALVLALGGILGFSLPHLEFGNWIPVQLIDPIIPYGVILFSLAGMTAVPQLEHLVDGRRDDYRRAVVWGTVIAGVLTMAFGYIVWGVSGNQVTEDAISGLQAVLGSGLAIPAALAGFLAVATSYFATATNVKETLEDDFRTRPLFAWLLAIAPPLAIFLLGGRSFLTLIGFSAAVFGGIMAVLVGLLYLKVRRAGLVREKPLRVPPGVVYVVIVVFGLGAVVELYRNIINLMG